jgi:hypothetical protein
MSVKITATIECDGQETQSESVTLTQENWPPSVEEYRKALTLLRMLLWERHPVSVAAKERFFKEGQTMPPKELAEVAKVMSI